jgi:serine/threonine-protein kinase HipA
MCQALSTPPAIKYEAHGGPGIEKILRVLSGSDEPAVDQATFLKANIWFWLLGATDGHAKNFSVALGPGGRYRLTPLYDILSVQPLVDAGQVRHNQYKFSMAVGDNRHYAVGSIMPRHFVQTARRAGMGETAVEAIFDELMEQIPAALEAVEAGLPEDMPADLAAPIFGGARARLQIARRG